MVKHRFNFVWYFITNLNYYPLNIFSHGLGAIGWSVAGYITKDKALLTNFGLQLPLFCNWLL